MEWSQKIHFLHVCETMYYSGDGLVVVGGKIGFIGPKALEDCPVGV
jgi:hypothetical protein